MTLRKYHGPPTLQNRSVDTIEIRGGQPLRGQVDVRGAKNLATKAMVASLLGAEHPARFATFLRSATSRSCAPSERCTASASPTGEEESLPRARPRRGRVRRVRGDRRALGLEPHSDPVLRSAAAPARPGVHPGSRRMPDRRPPDRLPSRCPAQLRRGRRAAQRHPPVRTGRPARRQHRLAEPERRSHGAGAARRP